MKTLFDKEKKAAKKYVKPQVQKHKSVVVVSGSSGCSWYSTSYNSDSGSYFH